MKSITVNRPENIVSDTAPPVTAHQGRSVAHVHRLRHAGFEFVKIPLPALSGELDTDTIYRHSDWQ